MFKLENITKLRNTILSIGLATLFTSSAFASNSATSVDGAVKYPIKDGKYTQYHINTQNTKGFNIGRDATKREIAAWNKDVMYDGTGLPEFDMHEGEIVLEDGKPKKAQGSVELGNELYDAQCVMCHGDFGSGGKGYPKLAGGSIDSLKNQRLNPADINPNPANPDKTIGSYWPYASTLFWYIQESMPFNAPKTLTNSETYAITAYLLSINNITIDGVELDDDYVLDREKFLKIVMPNVNGFYPETNTPKNPKQGVENMKKYLSNPVNYGKGERCMKNCIKGDIDTLVMRVQEDLSKTANEPLSTVRDLPKIDRSALSPSQAEYENAGCSACHANAAIGAPVLGDKATWDKLIQKGLDKVYYNGINGINSMPPRGGTDLSDDELKKIIDYMIEFK